MKTLLKVLGIIILIIFLALLILPFAFKGKIMEIAKIKINESVNAKVEFADLSLSFLKHFPNLTVELNDLSVTGIEEFEKDTLVAFKSFTVTVDAISAINAENIRIKAIILDNPKMNAKILENGKANWDIVVADEVPEEDIPDTSATEIPDIEIELKKFEIIDAFVSYTDAEANMSASLSDFDFILTGNFAKDFTTLEINSTTNELSFLMGGIPYLNKAVLNIDMAIDADLEKNEFTLNENEFSINNLTLGIDGVFLMPEDQPMDFDLTYYTKETSFKTLLSLVPAIYKKDFESVQTKGNLKLDGYIKGKYSETIMPNVGLELAVNDAMFKYPDLPESVDNININVNAFVDGVDNDNTTVDINQFHFEIADNPVDLVMNFHHPVSDLNINGKFSSRFDISSLADAVPMENVNASGVIIANFDMMGTMSMIEEERYEDFKADGKVVVDNLVYESPDIPQKFSMTHAEINFSPKFVEIAALNAGLGRSDFQFTGKLENFIPYTFQEDEDLQGSFFFTSSMLHLNELMADAEEDPIVEDTTSTPLEVVEVPKNIDVTLYSELDKIIYDNIEIDNAEGTIKISNQRILLDGFKMNMLEGSMVMNGEYNTQDLSAPLVDFGLNISGFNIPATYYAFNTVEQLAPIAKNLRGNVSMGVEFTSFLNSTMMPVLNSMVGKGSLSSNIVEITQSKTLNKLTQVLSLTKDFEGTKINDLDLSFEIRNGRVYVDPFDISFGNIDMIVSGDQGIDGTLNYDMNLVLPGGIMGSSTVNNLVSSANASGLSIDPGDQLNLAVDVGGTFTDPSIKPNIKSNVSGSLEAVKERAIDEAKQELEKKKEEVKVQASKQAEKILEQAEDEAEKVRAAAKVAADKVREEADKRAEQVLNEAKNPIAKRAAEPVAKKMRKEGEEKAEKIEDEADKKAEAILERAQKEADRLK
jgi:hypothetical protein